MNAIGYIHQSEYESQFWNMARHRATRFDSLSGGYNTTNSTYTLPSSSGTKLQCLIYFQIEDKVTLWNF